MKRSFLAIIICLSILLSMAPQVHAETTVVSSGAIGEVNYSLDSDGVFTLSGSGSTGDFTNADKLPYYTYMSQIKKAIIEPGVTAMGDRLFYGASNLAEVTIADTVTDIGEACFRQCTSLKSVVLPAGLKDLTRVAFLKCTALEEIDLGGVQTIGDKVFTDCAKLNELTIPASLTTLAADKDGVKSDAFAGIATADVSVKYDGTIAQWKALLETYPASILAQDHVMVVCADGNYNNATGEITVLSEGTIGDANYVLTSDGLMTISGTGSTGDYSNANKLPYYSFMGNIKKVVVEDGITHLATRLFYGATAMESISIAGTVVSIGEACFRQCSSLKSVILPDGLETLSRVAFYSCTALEEVDLGETVTVLGDKAFNGCGQVTKLTIPATLTTLAAENNGTKTDAFVGISITEVSVTYGGTVEQWKALLETHDSVLGKDYVNVTCTDGTYNSADDSGDTGDTTVLCEGITGDVNYKLTSDGVFTLSGTGATGDGHSNATGSKPVPWASYLSQIKTLIVEDGVTLIGNNLFRDAVNLKTVSLPDTLTSIGQCCFQSCTSLRSIVLPESLTTLKRVAFFGCSALEEVVLAGSYTQLADKLFTNCASLQKISIPATIGALADTKGTDAFAGVSPSWKNPVTVTYSGTIAQWQAMLEAYPASVLGQEFVTVICSDGEYIHTTVDASVSYGATGQVYWKYDSNTKTLYIGGNGETPADHSNVSGSNPVPWAQFIPEIENLVVEKGVTTLGQNLLRDAKKLVNVSLPDTLKSIGQATFRDCDALLSITVPDSVEMLTRTAFYDCDMLQEVVLGGTYTYLTDKLFQKCINLRKITIPGTVTYIDANAFGSCAQVNTIYFGGTRAQWYSVLTHSKSLGAAAIKKDYIKVYCTDGLYIDGFNSIENGLVYKIADGVLMIMGDGAIADYAAGAAPWSDSSESITAVILYNGVTGVGENAFADCTNLTTAVYQGTAEELQALKEKIASGNEPLLVAFENSSLSGTCGANATWTLDAATGKMTISGSGAIYNYESRKTTPWTNFANLVTELVIEEGITGIGEYAFNSLRNLEKLTLPSSLEILDTYCFGICPSLTTLVIPEGVRIIAPKVFNTCSGITTVYLPSTLEYVDMKAFEGATSITDVYYNGSQMDWNAIIISSNCLGNEYLTGARLHTAIGRPEYSDIVSDAWYASDVNYLLSNSLVEVNETSFGVDETENLELVLVALFNRAKVYHSYADAKTWATDCGIVSENASDELSMNTLSQILYRMACYNIYSDVMLKDVDNAQVALAWCKNSGFADALLQNTPGLADDAVLTRSQVCSVLASFLKDSVGTVNRYEKLVGTVRDALAVGGDGKLYILPLDITDHRSSSESGDGTFVLFPNGKTMLIDSFSSWGSAKLLSLLEAIGVKSLDHLVLSHAHADHIGNAQNVVNWIYDNGGTVGQYWSSAYIYPASTEDDLIALLESKGVTMHTNVRQGDQIAVDDVVINIYHPDQVALDDVTAGGDYANEYINNISMVIKFTYGTSSFLTSGDLHANQEDKLVREYGSALQADIMKSNHHGTYTSNSDAWMNAVAPKIVFTHASDLGEATFYENCLANGRKYYTVGLDGLILITMDNAAGYKVLTQYGVREIGHLCAPEKIEGVSATCTEPGILEHYKCECGLMYEDAEGTIRIADVVIPSFGHTDVTTDEDHDCDKCGEKNITEHTYTSVVTPPTCTEQGYTTHSCDCGHNYTDATVDALDHDWQTASNEKSHWEFCARCQATANTQEHQFNTTGHCSCGAKKPAEGESDIPKTGDSTPINILYLVMLLSISGIAVLLVAKRRFKARKT